ncbi:MAG: prepilin-type N-terminal cleavage/methylation domain-containing protein [bacterium]|nr:prepilin-type N-terminal cleavage/methylation domain-containing protein [Candidatus Colisoma equi]
MTSNNKGFTLIELLVVVAMLAVLMGAITTSVSSARSRARIQKATSDVKVISQAILSYEIWNGDELPPMERADADAGSLGFLIGKGGGGKGPAGANGGTELPVLLQAQLQGGKLVDPWGTPYKVTIRQNAVNVKTKTVTGTLNTGYWLPNFYRIGEGER